MRKYIKHWHYTGMQNLYKTFERENLTFFEKQFFSKNTRVTINFFACMFYSFYLQLNPLMPGVNKKVIHT